MVIEGIGVAVGAGVGVGVAVGVGVGVGVGVAVGVGVGVWPTFDCRKLATIKAVLFNACALSAASGLLSGTPIGSPPYITLGFEK